MTGEARVSARITPAAEAIRMFGRQFTPRPSPPERFRDTLAAAATVGQRFDLETEWHGTRDDRIVASELSDEQIAHGVALRGVGLGTADPKIASNMWLQWYAYRMAAPLLACWVLHRRIPDMSADNITFRLDEEGRPGFAALVEVRAYGLVGDAVTDLALVSVPDLVPEIVRVLLDGHLLPLARRVQAQYRLGGPITRGTIASQIGMALTAIDAHIAVPWESVAIDTMTLLDVTRPAIDGQGRSGDVICTQSAGRTGMTFRRGTCCLVYRVAGKDKCGGCPLRSDEERAGVYADRLAARPECSFV